MVTSARFFMLLALVVLGQSVYLAAQNSPAQWSQFRGPNGTGIAVSDHPPVNLDLKKNLTWSMDLPSGHSSPSGWGDRLYFTSFEPATQKLEVIAVDTKKRKIEWRATVQASAVEKVHEVSTPATGTPVTDGKRVYAYFGSYGLIAYDLQGKEQWKCPLPLPKMSFGSGTSPTLVGDKVILSRDESEAPFLLAVRASDGTEAWRQKYSQGSSFGAYSTPVLWNNSILVHRPGELVGFDPENGKQVWRAAVGAGASIPAVTEDRIYITSWSPFGEADHLPPLPSFDELLKNDKDGDGKVSKEEFPGDVYLFKRPNIDVTGSAVDLKRFFERMDQNKDGGADRYEWDAVREQMAKVRQNNQGHGLFAVDKEGKAVWREPRSVPEIASPIQYNGRVYMVTNGGIVTCVNAPDGKLLYRERLGAAGAYFASPVAANGHLYFASAEGVITTIKDSAEKLNVVAQTSFGEPIYATPAIAGNSIFVRTAKRLYTFQLGK
jgi:outer membrane protein assembly factor BamB